jgi:hypothetical protein
VLGLLGQRVTAPLHWCSDGAGAGGVWRSRGHPARQRGGQRRGQLRLPGGSPKTRGRAARSPIASRKGREGALWCQA